MNSFNHYAYGAIGEWLYRVVAGIEIDEQQPGYKHIIIQPHPGGGLDFAKASVTSMYGPVACEWSLKDNLMQVNIDVPANTTATVKLPNASMDGVKESGKLISQNKSFAGAEQRGSEVVLKIGSGSYQFNW
jgi:alpha-L-rhamnosidase